MLAFGSADHHIHYYDIRDTRQPVSIVRGHAKAVSYVKWVDSTHVVSASTDCTLRLWDMAKTRDTVKVYEEDTHDSSTRVYSGHVNEKNFVGLGVNSTGDFIACGSEENKVYVYFKHLESPFAQLGFGNPIDIVTGLPSDSPDPSQFVSSVCWMRKQESVLVAANSQGRVKVCELD